MNAANPEVLSRRSILKSTLIALSANNLSLKPFAADAPTPPVRRIVAVGGGLFSSIDPDRKMLRYILSLSGKPVPTICSVPTASGDNTESIVTWYETMHQLPCHPRHLRLFGPTNRLKPFKEQLAAADVILVPGGNTLNMLAVWRDQSIVDMLRDAWARGVVIAGESAGMICWFQQGITDSRPGALTAMPCLGWLEGSACPHYNNPQRRPAYHDLIATHQVNPGMACDDGCALLFEDKKLVRAVAINETAKAYNVRLVEGRIVESVIQPELVPHPNQR